MCIRDRATPGQAPHQTWLINKFFIITPEGILANPDKVEAIIRFPEPKNIKQLQSFLRLASV